MERLTDQLVGDVRAVVLGRVDVVDAGVDRPAQHGDRLVVVARWTRHAGTRQLHRAVAHPPDRLTCELERRHRHRGDGTGALGVWVVVPHGGAMPATLDGVLDPTELTTARLLLSPLRVADAPEMVPLLSDARMYEFTGGRPPTLDELTDRYERLAGGRSSDGSELWFNWIVRLRDGAVPVGVVQATVAHDATTADVAWEIGVEWQGRGFAGEAAVELVRWLTTEDVAQISALGAP